MNSRIDISSTVDTKRGEIGLDHRLYQSLDTHLDVHGRQTDFDELTDREWGVTGRLAYRKKTPLGNLLMSYARTLDQIDRSGASGRARYFDESLVLTSSRTQFLANPNVDGDSLYVTDAAGTTPYIEDLDYTLETRGNRTGLRLKRGGRLSEGATVLVDYDVEMTSDINYTADDQDFYLRYDFARALQGLGVYYRRHNLTPRGADTTDDMSILEFTDQLYGFNYNWRSLTWTEEYETYSSNFTNYDQTLSQLEGFHRVLNTLKWSWQTGLQTVQYHDDDREDGEDHSRILFAGATLNGPVSSRGYWELEARINKETGIIDETFTGVSGRLGMRWRKVKIEAGARLEQRERFDDTRDRAHVFFRFAREF
ncbi:MAG: hypothetical protein M1457_12105 [bacterium]|nr:hypothetical protein [bacterium]